MGQSRGQELRRITDVKPDNMLLREDGSVVLSDFGIVAIAHSTSSRSIEAMAGTAAYMPPEQMQGEPRPASDQYALAVTVYEWISGQLPFRGTAIEIAMQHAMKPPPSLVEQVPLLPRPVEQVVLTALAKDLKERFATIQAFAMALEQAVDSEQDVSTFIKPGNPPKASTPRQSTLRAARSAPTEPGTVAAPPTQSQSDRRKQATTPPLETRPPIATPLASTRISSQRSSGKHIRQPTASPASKDPQVENAPKFKLRYILGMALYLVGADFIGMFEPQWLQSIHVDAVLTQFNLFGGPVIIRISHELRNEGYSWRESAPQPLSFTSGSPAERWDSVLDADL